ncbi:CAMK/CAMKL/BRSK protein kinase [Spizellomyces punctatus DAOM BR117]|uniref:non-specific serine/threonine protein kinase n=1 Tax=Spizellomyces punctatus (strain DAOM BR117) TaxID=645134 RepID=A0A0L0HP48_SPIPD|nr:CAMK/CAMKL/BRSK protein kinase [Spizellomyces punctatus DAOM BR117]KND03181.1 CAMK/CAMKL/BRSK protein kinase [Spizellomyces punctatus DAOM BR117]|eukprot:XP_016611220.1 CAMK/CAMKL/BRSK protein kinase [Spizellomyces punctatus DAOM BR117]
MSATPPRPPLTVNINDANLQNPNVTGPRTPTSGVPVPPRPGSANSNRSSSSGGQRIGPYVVGKTLGVGSTGRVKLGTHIESAQRVAIKIIPKETLSTTSSSSSQQPPASPATSTPPSASASSTPPVPSINKKLEREITIMKLIQHPNVLQLYDVYETDKELFLILEHVEGGELFDYLVKKGRLSEQEALGFFQQIMFGIDFCHRYLICHRDLKPENLLLDKELNVKIADFGMASLQVTGKMLETSCGSPHYASPEIIKGIRYDGPAADIWSCGVILYALLTGNLPFDDENIRRLLSKVKSGMYFIPDHVSADAKDLIKRMLVVDPSKRITMKDIFRHPWFCSQTPKHGESSYPTPMDPAKLTKPVEDPSQLDPDILNSLSLLGWGDEKELAKALQDKEENMEKVFYNLLLQRKWDFFEHYDVRELSSWDVEGGPRRRTNSYASLNTPTTASRFDLFRSELTLASPDSTMRRSTDELRKSVDDLRRSREELRKSAELIATGSGSSASQDEIRARRRSGDVIGAASEEGKSTGAKRDSSKKVLSGKYTETAPRVNSPLSASTHIAAEGNSTSGAHTQEPTQNSSTPSTAEHSRSSSISRSSATGQSAEAKKKLTISIPASGDEGSGDDKSVKSGQGQDKELGTPKFHRKKPIVVPPTPIITSSPKRSWFANLFHFKPDAFTVYSSQDFDRTMTAIGELLTAHDIRNQPLRGGGYKCKFEASSPSAAILTAMHTASSSPSTSSPTSEQGNPPIIKNVKFRVDLLPNDEGEGLPWKLQFTQQQGANSTFQLICQRFKESWDYEQ